MRAMSKKKGKKPSNVIAQNKRASFDYQLLDTFEAGVALSGWEVKSLRMGKVDLADSYVHMQNGEAFLLNANINPLDTVSTHYVTEPNRTRKLLLHKHEIKRLYGKTKERGMTLVPLKLYFKSGKAKILLGLARGKHSYDKRQAIRQRDQKRDLDRSRREYQ